MTLRRDAGGRGFVEEGGPEHPLVHEDEPDGDYIGELSTGPIPETLLRTEVLELNTLEKVNAEIRRLKEKILSYEENPGLRWDGYAIAEVQKLKNRIIYLEQIRKNLNN